MVTIQLTDGNLDVGSEQAMELEVTAMRFSQGIRDAYTNDIDLPKTRNNIKLLECYNLLDSPNQLYGNQIKPAILTVDGYMLDVHLQVVEVTDDAITVCMYEQVLPNDLRDRAIRELIRDDENSIIAWNGNSMNKYPDIIRMYDYGSQYIPIAAQYHQVRGVDSVLASLSDATGHTLPTVGQELVMMAQNKYVCPENRRQIMSVQLSSDGTQDMCIVGGQHVVNDIDGYSGGNYQESDTKSFTFNRLCSGKMKVIISWGRKISAGTNTYVVSMFRNGIFETNWTISTSATGPRNGYIFSAEYDVSFSAGDVLSFRFDSPTTNNPQNKFDLVQMIIDFNWLEYDIYDDDYGQELAYAAAWPVLYSWDPVTDRIGHIFNGSTQTLIAYNWNGNSAVSNITYAFPTRAWSWHGYWCNLSDITVGQLLWGLAWYYGYGIRRSQTGIEWTESDRVKEIEGHVTRISPSSDRLGKKNYIVWNGQEDAAPVSVIDSEFLVDEMTLAELPFAYIRNGRNGLGKISQYEIKKDDDGNYDVSYNEIDGQVIMKHWNITAPHPYPALVAPYLADNFSLSRITSATEVDIETFDDQVTDLDYVYLDGRKYMIISVSSDLNDRFSKITALLVPTKSPLTPILWQQLQRQ